METRLFEKLSVNIPDGFAPVEGEAYKRFFGLMPLHYAFISQEKDSTIGVMLSESQLENEQVRDRIITYQQYYARMAPGFQMGEMRISDQMGTNVAFLSYKSNAPTVDQYNMFAVTTLEGRELIFLFSCEMNKAIRYMDLFVQTLNSMVFCGSDQTEGGGACAAGG